MGDISFAQFLIESGSVTREGLIKALELMETSNVKFCDVAMAMRLLTLADVEAIERAQLSEDLFFGDMAIKLGYLTKGQVQHIQTLLKNSNLHLGEALVDSGAVAEKDLPTLHAAYNDKQPDTTSDFLTIPGGVPHANICQITADLTNKMLSHMMGLSFLPGLCVTTDVVNGSDTTATINFSGYADFKYIFSVSGVTRDAIACNMLHQDSVEDEPLELREDAVKEFVNHVAGKVVSKAVDLGMLLEIKPPEISFEKVIGIDDDCRGVLFPMYMKNDDEADLCISMRKEK